MYIRIFHESTLIALESHINEFIKEKTSYNHPNIDKVIKVDIMPIHIGSSDYNYIGMVVCE